MFPAKRGEREAFLSGNQIKLTTLDEGRKTKTLTYQSEWLIAIHHSDCYGSREKSAQERCANMPKFSRQDRPPAPGPANEIVRVGSTGEAYGYCLSHSLEGYWMHWDGNRTQACSKDDGECKLCMRGFSNRWKGYIHFHCLYRKKEIFVELTPGAAEMLLSQVDKEASLRGLKIRIKRSGNSVHGRLRVEVDKYASCPENLAEPKEAIDALTRLFGWSEKA